MIWTPLNHSVFKKKGRLWFFLKEEEDYIMKKKITVLNKQLLTIMSNYKHEIFNDDLGWEICYLRDLQIFEQQKIVNKEEPHLIISDENSICKLSYTLLIIIKVFS
jgi:hypothetical protein